MGERQTDVPYKRSTGFLSVGGYVRLAVKMKTLQVRRFQIE